ncbi:MAG: BLUF domain-containing protein, partial [Pseudomonadota bacterium]
WLEGPRSAVDQLFDEIGRDPRHSDIEVVSVGRASSRVFADWNLRLFRDRGIIPYRLPLADPCDDCHASCKGAHEAARALIQGDSAALCDALYRATGQLDVQVCFLERVIQSFNELWADDACEHAEIVIGQAVALAAFRQATLSTTSGLLPSCDQRLLVAPMPGEPNYLRATLATTTLTAAGYPTTYLPASSERELVAELGKSGYFGLVLVTSDARLGAIKGQRVQSLCDRLQSQYGSALRIAVYGRLQGGDLPFDQGAGIDRLCTSAQRLPLVFDRRTRRVH